MGKHPVWTHEVELVENGAELSAEPRLAEVFELQSPRWDRQDALGKGHF